MIYQPLLRRWSRPQRCRFLGPSTQRTQSTISPPSQTAQLIEEQTLPGSRLRYFHPTAPDQILDGRFRTISKLGYGSSSTVWLAENLGFNWWWRSSIPRYVSIKIAALDTDASREIENSKRISESDRSHDGLPYLRLPLETFQLSGPHGTHSCLVYEPLRETLNIKDDNIMITFEDDAVLKSFVKVQKTSPQQSYTCPPDDRRVYVSSNDFGPLQGGSLLPLLGDFNLCFPGLADGGHLSAIQSHRYRAPEVLLGCPWTYSVDIWNMGLLMWNLVEDVSLFDRPAGDDGQYDAHVHLAQIVSLLGDPSVPVIERERLCRKDKLRLKRPVINLKGKECDNMNEFWGGPFFDEKGCIMRKDLITRDRTLADTVTHLQSKDKEQFLDLAGAMLHWIPEKRSTAKELMEHPFLEMPRRHYERYLQRVGRK
ncbi:protein kinase domain-containing protein [Cordyceps javanica]|uniref:non-specific serine/threonine protein kinase n=1 Tax=Cordyceps javanica TaxID=43265 RepID=A0A545UZ10_9HYPO|nr:protein kinase domain-containing protein [Cordyceps javanica]TQW06560.1 protein kinase domain protein [Cordyceps javanica]